MLVAKIFTMQSRGEFTPYVFEGDFTNEQKEEILNISQLPETATGGFNGWRFARIKDWYMFTRETWDMGGICGDWETVISELKDYYLVSD